LPPTSLQEVLIFHKSASLFRLSLQRTPNPTSTELGEQQELVEQAPALLYSTPQMKRISPKLRTLQVSRLTKSAFQQKMRLKKPEVRANLNKSITAKPRAT